MMVDDDDNSLTTIQNTIMNMHLANNANTQANMTIWPALQRKYGNCTRPSPNWHSWFKDKAQAKLQHKPPTLPCRTNHNHSHHNTPLLKLPTICNNI
jgi:hypothetical protein